jgi:Tetracyclin repressor-like, C-terminal domain
MSQFLHRMRYTMRRHPNALPIRSTRPAYVPSLLNFGERTLALLTGPAPTTAIDMVNCLATFTIGHAPAEVGEPVGGATAGPEELAEMVSGGDYPYLTEAFASGYEYRPDEQYERVLLLGGTKSPDYLSVALSELAAVLPHAQRVTLPGLTHEGPEDDGRPLVVAQALRDFHRTVTASPDWTAMCERGYPGAAVPRCHQNPAKRRLTRTAVTPSCPM